LTEKPENAIIFAYVLPQQPIFYCQEVPGVVRKWIRRSLVVVFVLSLVFVLKSVPREAVRAQGLTPRAYFPLIFRAEPIRFDDFEDEDPVWYTYRREVEDGFFYHRNGRLVGLITDNRANNIGYPGWKPLGDFKVEADVRYTDPRWMDGLGLVFCGNDAWNEYYLFMLGANTDQYHWAVARADPDTSDPHNDVDFHWLSNWEGTPGYVNQNGAWNHLAVVRQGSSIRVYANGRQLGNEIIDNKYGTHRQVGVIATSYEWTEGESEYDNFMLTPLSAPY